MFIGTRGAILQPGQNALPRRGFQISEPLQQATRIKLARQVQAVDPILQVASEAGAHVTWPKCSRYDVSVSGAEGCMPSGEKPAVEKGRRNISESVVAMAGDIAQYETSAPPCSALGLAPADHMSSYIGRVRRHLNRAVAPYDCGFPLRMVAVYSLVAQEYSVET